MNEVAEGSDPREKRRVRRKRRRGRRHHLLEQHALGREPIHIGRSGRLASVAREAVGPKGIDAHEHEVEGSPRCLSLRGPEAKEPEASRRGEAYDNNRDAGIRPRGSRFGSPRRCRGVAFVFAPTAH